MSAKLMGQVWDLDLPHNEAWVLMALVDHADHDGNNIYPGLELLSHKTGYSERQLRRVLDSLEEKQIIIPTRGGVGRGQRQSYRVDLKSTQLKPEKRSKGPVIHTEKSGHPDNRKEDKRAGFEDVKADISDSKKRTFEHVKADISGFSYKEEPSIEPSIEPSEREEAAALSGCLALLLETYRNIARDRMTQDQLSWQVQQIEADGATVEEVKLWLKSRHKLSSVRFIAQDFWTWRESQRFERMKQNAEAYVGASQSHLSPMTVAAASIPAQSKPIERRERKGAWGAVLNLLDETLSVEEIATWFEPLTEIRLDDGVIYLAMPDPLFRDWIENNYANEFYRAVEEAGFSGVVLVEAGEIEEGREAA